MNWVDTLVLLIIVASAVVAFARGFVAEVLAIGAWIGAFFVANGTAQLLKPSMRRWLGNPEIADPAAYAAMFLVALIVLSVITGMIGSAVRASMLGGLDRTLGVVFGFARGIVIVAAIYVAAGFVLSSDRWPDAVAEARSVPYVYGVARRLTDLLPDDYRPHVLDPPLGRGTVAIPLQSNPQGKATSRP